MALSVCASGRVWGTDDTHTAAWTSASGRRAAALDDKQPLQNCTMQFYSMTQVHADATASPMHTLNMEFS